jgi:hypothetical protein
MSAQNLHADANSPLSEGRVVRWTAVLDRTDSNSEHALGACSKLDTVPGVFGTFERMAFLERLAVRQGLSRPQGREIARVAARSEEALEHCLRRPNLQVQSGR